MFHPRSAQHRRPLNLNAMSADAVNNEKLAEFEQDVPAGQASLVDAGAHVADLDLEDLTAKMFADISAADGVNQPQIGEKLLDELAKDALLAKQAAVAAVGAPPSTMEDNFKKVCINRSVWVSSPATSQCSKCL